MQATSPAIPAEPVITIISSDGETFSINANTVAHSHLLDGALRKWTELYKVQTNPAANNSGSRGVNNNNGTHGRSGSLPNDDDATTTDATADDPEETPDERFIEGYYDETASDVTTTSGVLDDALSGGGATAIGAGGAGAAGMMGVGSGLDMDRPHVVRMVSVPVNDEDEALLTATSGIDAVRDTTPPYGDVRGDLDNDADGDSDRTASVLPSSHEGSLSSSTTPTKMSNTDTATTTTSSSSPSATAAAATTAAIAGATAPRSISPFLTDLSVSASSSSSSSKLKLTASAIAAAAAGASSRNGSVLDVAGTRSAAAVRSPANAIGSPTSRGSHPSPSTLMDADQSTPSVLSEEEEELMAREELEEEKEEQEEMKREEGENTRKQQQPSQKGPAQSHARADPRNLGDEGLDDETNDGDEGGHRTAELSPSPSLEAVVRDPPAGVSGASNHHVDPLSPTAVATATANTAEAKLPSPSSRSRVNERRHTATVVQAGAVEDDADDVLSGGDNDGGGGGQAAPHDLAMAAILSAHTPGSSSGGARSASNGGGGGAATTSHLTASPGAGWRSPSSCHQRTPCIADEDDVGAMVGEDTDNDASDNNDFSTNEEHAAIVQDAVAQGTNGTRATATTTTTTTNPNTSNTGGAGRSAALPGAPATEGGGGGSGGGSGGTPPATTDPLSPPEVTDAAASAAPAPSADPDSAIVYGDGIRITSSAIVFDLLQSSGSTHTTSTTPMVSPQSLREATASPEMPSVEHDLVSPSSAGGATVAGAEEGQAEKPPAVAATTTITTTTTTSPAGEAVPAGSKVSIHSTILTLCIQYMTHFAEAEADAAAKQQQKKKQHHRHRHRRRHARARSGSENSSAATTTSSSSSATSSASSNSDSDDEDEDDNSSNSSGSTTSSTTGNGGGTGNGGASALDSDNDTSTISHNSVNPPPLAGLGGLDHHDATGSTRSGGAVSAAGVGGARAVPPGGPAVIPAPLTAPLVTYLSPWERRFLYSDLLSSPESVLTAAMAIQEVCPDFDYVCPGPCLSNPRVRAALMTPPPPPEGVHTLMEVMAAAKQLQIDPLHALCAGWLADFMIRVSYGATDNFEAAHLIRQCLRVPSDWNRRETDCLKLENEWPANEDAE